MAEIMTYDAAVGRTIVEEMRRDKTIFLYSWRVIGGGAGIGSPIPPKDLVAEFGWERICHSGICEYQEAGAAIGAALAGTRPICDLYLSSAALDAWQEVVNILGTMRFKVGYKADCPAVIRMPWGRYMIGTSVHHSNCCHNWVANSPGLLVAVPSTPADVCGLWRTALRETKDPVVMMEHVPLSSIKGPVPEGGYTIPFGKAEVKREGKDVTIAGVGYMVYLALLAAEDLAKEGISAEVWDPRTLTPFDRESLIASVKKTGAMVVVDQAPKSFGTTGEFSMTVAEALTPVPPMARVASMDAPIGFSPPLEAYVMPDKAKIISAVKAVLARKK